MDSNNKQPLPAADKKIPLPVVLIGSFEIAISLLGLVVLVLVGQFNGNSVAFLVLLAIYAAMGAGLLAIQEWARNTNVVLHIVAVPYALYTSFVLGGPTDWRLGSQLVISAVIVIALTRPAIKYKFQTTSSKRRS